MQGIEKSLKYLDYVNLKTEICNYLSKIIFFQLYFSKIIFFQLYFPKSKIFVWKNITEKSWAWKLK
jgi:hypothetical protein